jgi:RNA polymerase sigma-70 factor (ECF subfamily)
LLVRVRADDQDAWRRLVDLYSPLVAHWCRQWGAPPDDVPDIVQDVFTAVARGLKTYRLDQPDATFRGWLRGIVRHKLTDQFRRNAGRAEGGSTALLRLQGVADDAEPDLSEGHAEVADLYRRALEQVRAQFEERTWQAFWRVAMENQSPEHVAAELGITANGVRQAKSRVLRRLKEELGELIV